MIDRRKAILTLMGAWAAIAGGQKKEDPKTGFITYSNPVVNPPTSIICALDSFTGFDFQYKGKTITIPPEEIWEALGGAK